MKKILLAAVLVAAPSVAFAGKLVVENSSLWDIQEAYVSSVDDDEWGPDQLGANVLESGQTWTLTGVECGDYDLKLVDEDGDVCVKRGIEICGTRTWALDNDELLSCQVETDE